MRGLLPWIAALLVAAVAGAGAVLMLGATLFGASGFVRIYLDAVARGDAASAIALPGVDLGDADPRLVVDDALHLDEYRVTGEADGGDGIRLVSVAWSAGDETGETEFAVERVGTRFGLFPEWGFARSPVETLDLAVLHDPRFRVNGTEADTGLDSGAARPYALLVPGAYRFDHDSAYLSADPVTVLAERPGARVDATVDVQPAPELLAQVQTEVDDHLDGCATQQVLFPTGCPFGYAIADRVASTPSWEIVQHPALEVRAADEFERWEVPAAEAVARLTVDVQSLFDGSVEPREQDVVFEVRYLVEIVGEHTLRIVAQYD